MKVSAAFLVLHVLVVPRLFIAVQGQERFFYKKHSDWVNGIMSPSDWDQVECEDLDTCVSTLLVVNASPTMP